MEKFIPQSIVLAYAASSALGCFEMKHVQEENPEIKKVLAKLREWSESEDIQEFFKQLFDKAENFTSQEAQECLDEMAGCSFYRAELRAFLKQKGIL